ncbi:MAG: GNAT family N-acetyltransferase [candidate division WOR-3 bacterium]|nr:GNAT family N-acetyltransferase [candidate division WOR-3 bacterium]
MSDLQFRSIERADIGDVLSLFRRVFRRDGSAAYYEWQFFDCPFGGGHSQGVWLDGKLVAHIGYTPRIATVNGREGRVLSNHTVMSDPDHRGKGYYSKLVSWALNRFAGEGWDMVLSHPNRESHPVQMMQPGYADVAVLPALSRRSREVTSLPSDVVLDERFSNCTEFGDEYGRLCEVAPGGALYAFKRSPGYLSWRYGRHPVSTYFLCEHRSAGKLQSAAIAKLYPQDKPTRVNIVEWLCSDEDRDVAEKPIKEILDLAGRAGLEVQLWHGVHDRIRRYWLERLGFENGVPAFYFGVYSLQNAERLGPYTDFRHWYTTMGDHDVF